MKVLELIRKANELSNLIQNPKIHLDNSKEKIKSEVKRIKKQIKIYVILSVMLLISSLFILFGMIFFVNRFLPIDLTLFLFGLLGLIIYLMIKVLE